jgi:hypothetical protein
MSKNDVINLLYKNIIFGDIIFMLYLIFDSFKCLVRKTNS